VLAPLTSSSSVDRVLIVTDSLLLDVLNRLLNVLLIVCSCLCVQAVVNMKYSSVFAFGIAHVCLV